jgi:hypothetical protein
VVAVYAGWLAASLAPAQAFTWAVGVLYFALGVHGWLRSGLLLGTPFAVPLGVADSVFHFVLSLPALAIVVLHGTGWSRPPRSARGRRTPA